MRRRTWVVAALLAVVVLVAGVAFKLYRDKLYVALPDYPPVDQAKWLAQDWSADDQDWFHHVDQGTQTLNIPYEWFVALEQPRLSPLGDVGRLGDPAYLDRYGFIPGATRGGEVQLPIGFAKGDTMLRPDGRPWVNPKTNQPMHAIGFTCAACHTGRLTYRGTALLVDGGPALTDLGKFRQGLGISILFTKYVPFRFDRFATNVLGEGADQASRTALRGQLDELWDRLNVIRKLDKAVEDKTIDEGYGRLDALNRIGNQVFALDLGEEGSKRNYSPITAPVSYPHIWNTSWFDWVQYNASIEQPMVRNAGEALGVSTPLNLTGPEAGLFTSSVRVQHLARIERQIAGHQQPDGQNGFGGLSAPKWPGDILPPADPKLAAAGAGLYDSLCKGCHLPPVGGQAFWNSRNWLEPNQYGQRHLHVATVPIARIGTDERQAADMAERRVWTPENLKIGTDGFGPALAAVVERTVSRWYDTQVPPTSQADRDAMNGFRPNRVQAPLAYKARPLNGVWATSPFLHNGAVPNVYALLSPASQRPKTFEVGRREYDTICMGYHLNAVGSAPTDPEKRCLDSAAGKEADQLGPLFTFDTSIAGNRNTGHEFAGSGETGAGQRPGLIGRELKPAERLAIIEFLKSDCVNGRGGVATAGPASTTSCAALGVE